MAKSSTWKFCQSHAPDCADAGTVADLLVRLGQHLDGLGIAHQVQAGVQHVDADVDDRTAPLELFVGKDAPSGNPAAADRVDPRGVDVPDLAPIDDPFRRLHLGGKAVVQPKGEHFAHPLRRLHHLARLGGGHRRGFFTEDVASRLQRGDGRRRVKLVGGADAHRVQLFFFQHLSIVLVGPAKAKAFGHLFSPLVVDVRAGDQLHLIAGRLVARDVGRLRNASDSDDPDFQFGHEKRSLRLVLRRKSVLSAARGPASALGTSS